MSNKSPIFPISEPQHYNDYGFDPVSDYFQVLEEAKNHTKSTSKSTEEGVGALHLEPVSKNGSPEKNKKRWWKKNPLQFFKGKWPSLSSRKSNGFDNVGPRRVGAVRVSMSGPVYSTESRSGSSTPHRSPSPIAGSMSPAQIPYVSLREVNVDQHRRVSTSAMPVYLVT